MESQFKIIDLLLKFKASNKRANDPIKLFKNLQSNHCQRNWAFPVISVLVP